MIDIGASQKISNICVVDDAENKWKKKMYLKVEWEKC